MELLQEYIVGERDTLLNNSIRFRAVGRLQRMPSHLQRLVSDLTAVSAGNLGMTLSICLSYGGREEIADAAQELARRVQRGEMKPEDVNEAAISQILPTLDGVGPVDLMIRTGGEFRTSNFLVWAGAYAELCFSPKLWPEFGQRDLYEGIRVFQQRNRRFGLADNVQGPNVTASQEVLAKAIAG
jgi:undecaprenyl diphosphate synthase